MDFNCRDLTPIGFECCSFCHIMDDDGNDGTFKIRVVVNNEVHYISLCCKAREVLGLDLGSIAEVYSILVKLVIEYLSQLHPVIEDRIRENNNVKE